MSLNEDDFLMSADQKEFASLIHECLDETEIMVINARNRATGKFESLICSFEDDGDGATMIPLGIAFEKSRDVFADYELPFGDEEEESGLTDFNFQFPKSPTETKRNWWKFW